MEKLSEFTLTLYVLSVFILGITFILILAVLNSKKKLLLDLKKKELAFQTTLNKLQLRTIEEERRKLGSTLHDDLGQILNLMHMQLSELKKIHVSHDLESSSLKMTEELCNAASEKCSSISKMLFPATLIRLGFIEGLHELISDIQHATGIHIVFKHDDFEISDDRASNLFRIFQELLNNTLKHAKANKINIEIQKSTTGIKINYSDNGVGIVNNNKSQGLGTTTIKTRLHILGGEILESKLENKGFKMSFIMPYGKD
jgi:two-component system NarL family sensor kinase